MFLEFCVKQEKSSIIDNKEINIIKYKNIYHINYEYYFLLDYLKNVYDFGYEFDEYLEFSREDIRKFVIEINNDLDKFFKYTDKNEWFISCVKGYYTFESENILTKYNYHTGEEKIYMKDEIMRELFYKIKVDFRELYDIIEKYDYKQVYLKISQD